MPRSGSETLPVPDTLPPASSMNTASPMCGPTTFDLFGNAISSPASAAGPMRSSLRAGPKIAKSGPDPALVSPSASPASAEAPLTNDIFGPHGSDSSSNAAPMSSSASKSRQLVSSAPLLNRVKTCKACLTEKSSSEFYVNSKGAIRSVCKDCDREAERARKRSNPDIVSARHKKWRKENRGFALVNVARHRAKSRGLPFDLSPIDIQRRIDGGYCELTGIAFNLEEPRAWNAPSLDQRNPGGGYTRENVRVVLYALNVMANVWGENRIIEIASAISARRVERSNDLSRAIAERLKPRLLGSPEYEVTWSELVTPSGHVLPRLRARARPTSDSGCSGWPTPTRDEKRWSPEAAMKFAQGERGSHNLDLGGAVQLVGWPTPMSKDQRGIHSNCWGQPLISGPMPNGSPASTEKRGVLNPAFSLWLMNYPPQWMALAPSAASARSGARETPSSHH